ncbi:MAG: polyprenyl synthetase family protein [Clostridia bacterium]|nr:polyprenyl synthetase family protein [Clostridia bacterium]
MKTLKEYAQTVNARLNTIFPALPEYSYEEGGMPELLARSMNYSLLAGGKRLRPSMLLAAVDMLGGDTGFAMDFACAVEMIHSYSLIHDDLPGMDDDTMRRGRPTNHVVFGVGQAILAGDGLLNGAFELMLNAALGQPENAQKSLRAIREIATGAGITGMIAGQVMDLYCEHNAVANEKALSYIQRDKTACMFIYPLRAAGQLAGASEEQIEALGRYGEAFGRIFQATDDLLDVTGSSAEMGKTLGKDAEQGKLTMISLYGVEGTRKIIDEQLAIAMEALSGFGEGADFFRGLVQSMITRTN